MKRCVYRVQLSIPGIFPLELLSSLKTIQPMEIIQHLWNAVKSKGEIQLVICQSSCCENITESKVALKKTKSYHKFLHFMNEDSSQ